MKPRNKFLLMLRETLEPILIHTIAMLVTIFSIWLMHLWLKFTLGEDAKLFERIPIIYLIHLGDFLVMIRFAIKIVKEF